MKVVILLLASVLLSTIKVFSAGVDVFRNDTAYIVNYDFIDVKGKDTLNLNLNIPAASGTFTDYKFVTIVWGDSLNNLPNEELLIPWSTSTQISRSHKYGKGLHTLVISYYKSAQDSDPVKVHKLVFNQNMKGSIVIEGDRDGCMEWGVDTFLLRMVGNEDNPPGTEYYVGVTSDLPQSDWKWDILPKDVKSDSAYLVFTGPTGLFGAMIWFDMIYYENKTNPKASKLENKTDPGWVHVYKAPDLNEIFHFRDSLAADESAEDFEFCTDDDLSSVIQWDSLESRRFMYRNGFPNYGHRGQFDVQYFWKDSVDNLEWANVTQDTEKVDTANIIFKYPGFYKIEIKAWNECGMDFLKTDSVVNREDTRMFKIFQSGENTLACLQDTLCLPAGEKDTLITFVDRGMRYRWDPMPEYTFTIARSVNGIPDERPFELGTVPAITLWGKNDSGEVEKFNQSFAALRNSDSIYVQISLDEPGTYDITLTRTRHCDLPTEFKHRITIGDKPYIPRDTLWAALGGKNAKAPIQHCDTMHYSLPDIQIRPNNMNADSVRWRFVQGLHSDTLTNTTKDVFVFDSTGNVKNYVILDAWNYCGWSVKDSVQLDLATRPNVELWRDSLHNNDTLCAKMPYQYYFRGTLPDTYKGRFSFDHKNIIDGTANAANSDNSFAQRENDLFGRVEYPDVTAALDSVVESFIITNRKMETCIQKYQDTLYLVQQPDTVIYNDTIHHCSSVTAIHSEYLFREDRKSFKYILWELNKNLITGKFPDITPLRINKLDTLVVTTGNAKGCKISKELILKSEIKPKLLLTTDRTTVCADTTVGQKFYTSFLDPSGDHEADGMALTAYRDTIGATYKYYAPSESGFVRPMDFKYSSKDTVRLIYELKNKLVSNTAAFGLCEALDTITVWVSKPKLKISAEDTIKDLSTGQYVYKFDKWKNSGKIDTADILQLKWTALSPMTGVLANETDLYGATYTLSNTDKTLDTLRFELSGRTECGRVFADTLFVYMPNAKFLPVDDTICNTNEGYALWVSQNGKTNGIFIDTTTLKWEILSVSGKDLGTFLPVDGLGPRVQYVPGADAYTETDVKIKVSGCNMFLTGNCTPDKRIDAIVSIKVNHAPARIYPDTLWVPVGPESDRRVTFANIKTIASNAYSTGKYWWLDSGSGGLGIDFYEMGAPAGKENYTEELDVQEYAQKGCVDSTYDVTLIGVMPLEIEMKTFDLCDGDSLRLNELSTVHGKDKFTTLTWTKTGGAGSFNADFSAYESVAPDNITKVKLAVSKTFTAYDGTSKTYSASKEEKVTIFQKPEIRLTDAAGKDYLYDTLCLNVENFTYQTTWVKSNYDAKFFTIVNSVGVEGAFPDFKINAADARFVVSADLGQCKTWAEIGDTIRITRLQQMTGDFTVDNICVGEHVKATISGIDPLAKNVVWKYKDQLFAASADIVPMETGALYLSMGVVPPANCTDTTWLTHRFTVFARPLLALGKDTTICATQTEFELTGFTVPENVTAIWKQITGTTETTVQSGSSVYFPIAADEIAAGVFQVYAELQPNPGYPCAGPFYSDTLTVTLQKVPFIDNPGDQSVCQGTPLDLSGISILHATNINWISSVGTIQSNPHLQFVPSDDVDGEATITVYVDGLHGCASTSGSFKVDVKPNPLPVMTIPDVTCSSNKLVFTNETPKPTPNTYECTWQIAELPAVSGNIWSSFEYTFPQAQDYTVQLTVDYKNTCPSRTVSNTVSIKALPQPLFSNMPAGTFLGQNKTTIFTNETPSPEEIGEVIWKFGDGLISGKVDTCHHQYAVTGAINVTLVVTNNDGCTDSVSNPYTVIAKPNVNFIFINPNECSGYTEFRNTSTGEGTITYSWNFGNGAEFIGQVPAGGVNYSPVLHDSIYQVKLRAESVAGTDSITKPFKVISLLEPHFKVLPDRPGCIQLEKRIVDMTLGKATGYKVDWGDGKDTTLTSFPTHGLAHAYENEGDTIGKYAIKMWASNACHSMIPVSEEHIVNVFPNKITPDVAVSYDPMACFPLDVTFFNQTPRRISTMWYFGNEKVKEDNSDEVHHIFTKPGAYSVRCVLSDGCNNAEYKVTINVKGNDKLAFVLQSDPLCTGQDFEISLNPDIKDLFTTPEWTFNGENREGYMVVYGEESDAKTVRMTVTAWDQTDGCPTTLGPVDLAVNPSPETNFEIAPAIQDTIIGEEKEITFKSTTPGEVHDFVWDFYGLGTTVRDAGNGMHVHSYDLLAPYPPLFTRASLSVTSQAGCKATKTKGLKIIGIPEARFEFVNKDTCTGVIELKNLSAGEDISYHWKFGDGQESTDINPTVTYPSSFNDTTFEITLTVKNVAGQDTWSKKVKVISRLQPEFAIDLGYDPCKQREIVRTVTNQSAGRADQYIVNWGDKSALETYTNMGVLSHNYINKSDTIQRFQISLQMKNVCWTPTHIDSITVYPKANVELLADVSKGCYPLDVNFTNNAFAFLPDAQAIWYFEPGQGIVNDNNKEVPHLFKIPGQYKVWVSIKDECTPLGLADTVIINVQGDDRLDFVMSQQPHCTGQNLSAAVLPSLRTEYSNFTWDFQDGTTMKNKDSVSHTYLTAKNYSVILNANSIKEGNCPIVIAKNITVTQTPVAQIADIGNGIGCAPYLITFRREAWGDDVAKVDWDFGNGVTSAQEIVPDVRFEQTGKYNVLLKLTSSAGCTDTVSKSITVLETPLPDFSVSDSLFCTEDGKIRILIHNLTTGPEMCSFEWRINDTLYSYKEDPGTYVPASKEFKDYVIRLTAYNNTTHCPATSEKTVVSAYKVTADLQMDRTKICDQTPVNFVTVKSEGASVKWDMGDGTIQERDSFTYIYEGVGEYEIKLVANSDKGCIDTMKRKVIVYPLPRADFSWEKDNSGVNIPGVENLPPLENGGIKFDNYSDVHPLTWGDSLRYEWNFDDQTGISKEKSPFHRFPNNGTYEIWLKISTEYGCLDSLSETIHISAVKGLFMPNAFAPAMGDEGVNRFQPKGIGLHSYKIQVYDTWGTCVWTSERILNGHPEEYWDGTFKGQPLPKGVYLWKATAIFLDGSVLGDEIGEAEGSVTLIR